MVRASRSYYAYLSNNSQDRRRELGKKKRNAQKRQARARELVILEAAARIGIEALQDESTGEWKAKLPSKAKKSKASATSVNQSGEPQKCTKGTDCCKNDHTSADPDARQQHKLHDPHGFHQIIDRICTKEAPSGTTLKQLFAAYQECCEELTVPMEKRFTKGSFQYRLETQYCFKKPQNKITFIGLKLRPQYVLEDDSTTASDNESGSASEE